ncbi:DUF1048 domain-containing protein [Microbispora catharanthi]|uniref:DUF1048 domain-containing protein n=1 Tax=Microbispora catharanthi TaxID=1712871 RepID=A0A5N6C528_9ACTN|nr:DUF1048 domain-containing protein [Microbispora catharanthi]KAB8187914.1 DUF1048 domain-containing protein [Microbispora catharanthi]
MTRWLANEPIPARSRRPERRRDLPRRAFGNRVARRHARTVPACTFWLREQGFSDIAEGTIYLFEQAAVDGTPIREIVGDDPVEFAEAFVKNYSDGGYAPARERKRLINDIARAVGEDTAEDDKTL